MSDCEIAYSHSFHFGMKFSECRFLYERSMTNIQKEAP